MRLNIIDALFQPHARCLQAAIFRIATDHKRHAPTDLNPIVLPRFSTLLMWQKMSGPPPPSGCRKPYPLTENHFTHRPCDRPSSTTSNLLRNLQPVNIGASASTPMTVHAKSALSIWHQRLLAERLIEQVLRVPLEIARSRGKLGIDPFALASVQCLQPAR